MNRIPSCLKSLVVYLFGGLLLLVVENVFWNAAQDTRLSETHNRGNQSGHYPSQDSLLLEEAFRQKLHLTDPVVYQHVLRNMKLQLDASDFSNSQLFEQASEIGLFRDDSVVRSRLIYVMRQSLAAVRSGQHPTQEEVTDFVRKNSEYFTSPERFDFSHIIFRTSFRGESARMDAESTLKLLSIQKGLDYSKLGDPLLNARSNEVTTASELVQKYGRHFVAQLRQADVGVWQDPIKSRFGYHLVRLRRITPAQTKDLGEVQNQARGKLLRKIESNNLQEGLETLARQSMLLGTHH